MPTGVYIRTEKHIELCRKAGVASNKFKTPEWRARISKKMKEIQNRPENIIRLSNQSRERWKDPELHKKVSEINSIRAKEQWKNPKYREFMLAFLKTMKGEKAANWQGGKSFEPYSPQFNKDLKLFIRQRDNFNCQECGIQEYLLYENLHIHHIDYDKLNSLPIILLVYVENAMSIQTLTEISGKKDILRYYMPEPAIQVLRAKDKRYKILYGGRGSGKSTACANYVITEALSNKRILCAREYQMSIRDSVHRLLCDCISNLKLERAFIIQQDCIKSIYGSEIIFRGLRNNPSESKSLEKISLVWCEEAEKISEASWEILTPTIRMPGSEIIVSFNPESADSPAYKRFVLDNREDAISAKLNWNDNDWFPDVLKKEMEWDKRVDPEKYSWIWEGSIKKYAADVIFKDKFIVEEFETPKDARFYFGADWGFSDDPSCLERMFIKDHRLYIDYEFYAHHVELNELSTAFKSVPESLKWNMYGDASRPDTISLMAQYGFRIKAADKGKDSVSDGIQFLRSFEKIIIHPRCKGAVADFSNYRWKKDPKTDEVLPIPLDRANHAVDACRYALFEYIKRKISGFDVV